MGLINVDPYSRRVIGCAIEVHFSVPLCLP
jgi:hypothetical protein